MNTTLELLDHVRQGNPDSSLAHYLHISPTTISMARKVGRVSPELAARLARTMTISAGFDDKASAEVVKHWVTVAVAEQLPDVKRDWLFDAIGINPILLHRDVALHEAETQKPPEGGSVSWRKRRDSNPR
jgi:hypothetical protein